MLPPFWLMLQHQTVIKPPETPWLLHSSGITFDSERKGKLSVLHKVCFILDYNLLFSFLRMPVWLSPHMSTTSSTQGLITPALCCQLRNTHVLRPTSRPETGKIKRPSVPASQLRCLQQAWERHVLRSGQDAQEILMLILIVKLFFLKHAMLEHLNHNSTWKSNRK